MLIITIAFSKSQLFCNSNITDQHKKYNNNEKVLNIMRIAKLTRDIK